MRRGDILTGPFVVDPRKEDRCSAAVTTLTVGLLCGEREDAMLPNIRKVQSEPALLGMIWQCKYRYKRRKTFA